MKIKTVKNTLLVVEGVRDQRDRLCQLFGEEYRVLCAESCAQALLTLREEPRVDALLLGGGISDVERFALLRALRADETLRGVPLLALTEEGDESAELSALEAGAADAAASCRPLALRWRVRRLVESRRQELCGRRTLEILERDTQTGLLTQQAFCRRAGAHLREDGESRAFFCWKVEGLEAFRGAFGPEACQRLLQRMGRFFRELLPEEICLCARWEANLFVGCMTLERFLSENAAQHLVEGIAQLRDDFEFAARVGVSVTEEPRTDAKRMCDLALRALCQAERSGDRRVAYYSEAMRQDRLEEQALTNEIMDALSQGRIAVDLQPQTDCATRRVCGARAFARWPQTQRRWIPPEDFLPLLEKNNLRARLNAHVFAVVCSLQRAWLDKGIAAVPITIGLERGAFFDPRLCAQLRALTAEYRLPPSLLRLEIARGAFEAAPEQTVRRANALREAGFSLILTDDDGKIPSLEALCALPADWVRLDARAFTANVSANRRGVMTESVAQAARRLGISVLAANVETARQAASARKAGCRATQGRFVADIMDAAAFEALLVEKCAEGKSDE